MHPCHGGALLHMMLICFNRPPAHSCKCHRRMARAEVLAELETNRQIGSQTRCWKGGQLVEDDQGTLKAFFASKDAVRARSK